MVNFIQNTNYETVITLVMHAFKKVPIHNTFSTIMRKKIQIFNV